MQIGETMHFSISNDKIFCATPRGGIDVSDFLQIMRKSLDTYRSVVEKVKLHPVQEQDVKLQEPECRT